MQIEAIKLSKKRNGKGYCSGCSISISNKEAEECGITNGEIIKIIDPENGQIIIKRKAFTVNLDMLKTIVSLKEAEKFESSEIEKKYLSQPGRCSAQEMIAMFVAEQSGEIQRPAQKSLESYLMSLSVENVADIALLMYIGRDMDCNMTYKPGIERFLEFYSRYRDIVCGVSQEVLVDMITEKLPLLMYLRNGYRLLYAPTGTSLDEFGHNWDEI